MIEKWQNQCCVVVSANLHDTCIAFPVTIKAILGFASLRNAATIDSVGLELASIIQLKCNVVKNKKDTQMSNLSKSKDIVLKDYLSESESHLYKCE